MLFAIIRTFGIFCGIFVTFPWVMVGSLFRLFNGVLLKWGVSRHYLASGWIMFFWAKVMLLLAGVRVRSFGIGNVRDLLERNVPFLGLFQHASNLDAFSYASGPLFMSYVGKKSLTKIPFVGWMFYASGALIPIDRKNGDVIVHDGIPVDIFPEGTRSKTGQIIDFKMGAFHMAKKAKIPLVPMLISGSNSLWPHGQMFPSEGTVAIRILKTVYPEEYENLTARELKDKIRELMLGENAEEYPISLGKPSIFYRVASIVFNFIMYILFYYHLKYLYFVPFWWLGQILF